MRRITISPRRHLPEVVNSLRVCQVYSTFGRIRSAAIGAQMAVEHDQAYQALIAATRDPAKKQEAHDDPVVGPIIKKLSEKDLTTLREVATHQQVEACCPVIMGGEVA